MLLNRWSDSCMRFWKEKKESQSVCEIRRRSSAGRACWIPASRPHSPLHRPLPGPCRTRWEHRRRWCRSRPRSSGSTSSSPTSDLPHQTSCWTTRKSWAPHRLYRALPGPPVWALPEVQLFAGELFFDDTGGFDSRSQHVLLGGHVVRLADPLHFIEVAAGGKERGQQWVSARTGGAISSGSTPYHNGQTHPAVSGGKCTAAAFNFDPSSVPCLALNTIFWLFNDNEHFSVNCDPAEDIFPRDWPLWHSIAPGRDSLSSRVVQLELSRSVEGGLHAGVFPQLLDDIAQLLRHCAFLDGVRQVLQLLSVLLWCHQHTSESRRLIVTLTDLLSLKVARRGLGIWGEHFRVMWDLCRGGAEIDAQHLHSSD